ncbi:DUF4190 domain-containing protein [Archangium violaceum]|uniref:DUF4190 domain-containing protein n=1 Tax=Archangium violaceum Cb vi76 TaxID=1406225 RepID=A0A084T193_9BACT|nr:DUF4190 domain-containing protein [Archangium violaceum]KFA94478.1 hypothetical protein Q664_02920 [Archangium violaceum Cb vi76]
MESLSPAQPPAASEARCPAHPQKPVLGACARCGTFFCEYDRETVNGKDYCDTCAEHPDVDYLEAFRLKYWGKRDAWTWLVGFGAVFNFFAGAIILANELVNKDTGNTGLLLGLIALVGSGVGVCFWMGMPFARLALCFVPIASLFVSGFVAGAEAVGRGIWPVIITFVMYNNTRNKLFFKEEVSREALQKAWHLYSNNTVARAGFMLSFLSLLIGVLAPISLLCSIIGLRRVNPTATPPVGRKGQAIAGIVISSVSLVGWGTFFGATLLKMLLR